MHQTIRDSDYAPEPINIIHIIVPRFNLFCGYALQLSLF